MESILLDFFINGKLSFSLIFIQLVLKDMKEMENNFL